MAVITPFDPWKGNLCTCPDKYSISAYVGCGHGCRYCYASSYIVNFFSPRPKKNFLLQLKKEIKKLPEHAIVTIANSSDPYQPREKHLRLTRALLTAIKDIPLRIQLVTKSPLIARDIDILKECRNIVVSFTLTTLNKHVAKRIEPLVPGPGKKLQAIETLARFIPVVCRYDPLLYPLNTGEMKELIRQVRLVGVQQIITSTYKAKPDNFRRVTELFPAHRKLWQKIYYQEGERIAGYMYLAQKLRRQLVQEVKAIAVQEKLNFSSCREGFSQYNTATCDGSAYYRIT